MFLCLVLATMLGCLFAATLESRSGHDAIATVSSAFSGTPAVSVTKISEREPRRRSNALPVERATFPEPGAEDEMPASPTTSNLSAREAAAFCDTLDLIDRPDLADDMVKIASDVYGTPPGLLNGVWHTESHHGIDGQTGSCNVMERYAIRDCWKPGQGTRRPKGCTSPFIFVGEEPSETRWKKPPHRVGNGTTQKASITRIAGALGIDAWSIKGSCGNRILTGLKDPAKRPTHGGCFGNMQITPSEWERDVTEMGFGLSELDPFNVCDSMLVSSYRLRKHHDQKLARYMKNGSWQSRQEEADRLSWLWAGRRYYGSPEKSSTNKYERYFKYGRPKSTFRCGWQCWDRMAASRDFSPLNDYIRKRGHRERRSRRYASN